MNPHTYYKTILPTRHLVKDEIGVDEEEGEYLNNWYDGAFIFIT